MKKGVIISIVAVIIILAIIFVFFINHDPSSDRINDPNRNQLPNTFNNSQLPYEESNSNKNNEIDTENCNVQFTEYLIEPSYVQKLGQIGVVHGSGKNIVERSYISIKNEFYEQKIPIYSPTDMTLQSGARYKISPDPNYMEDYVLKFDAGCKVEVLLGHLKDVIEPIRNQLTQLKNDSREDQLKPIKFKAGDLIGYYYQQSSGGVGGFDFVVRDRKIINKFINQERYSNMRADNLISGVCPYDFYSGEKKEVYYNLLGGAGGTLFKIKNCGNASRDAIGTISGMWFLDKEITGWIYDYYMDGEYGSPVSVVGDEESIHIGNLGQQSAIIRIYSNNPTYKLPEEVKTEHCYQIYQTSSQPSGYIYFKIVDNATVDIFYSSSGNCPSSFPSGGKRYYK